jgi:hypothetical protein
MAKKDKKVWTDSRGNEIPAKYVPEHEKKRDLFVEKIMEKVEKLENTMRVLKGEIQHQIQLYIEELAADNKVSDNWKGNLMLTNFSGTQQIEVDIHDLIRYDERLVVAKQLIDNYLMEKCAGQDELRLIVSQAFNIDKKGNVNQYMLKRLCKLDIKNPEWQKAITLIKEAECVNTSKQYIMFKQRENPKAAWDTLNLNFSSIEGKEPSTKRNENNG